MYKKYHSKFSSIDTLTSADFLIDYYTCSDTNGRKNPTVTLVDVRTKAEQKVSMIPGAITLHEFESQLKQNPNKWQGDGALVITYCTIGYRSGLEAQRLREVYNLRNIQHLDGIVPYTHACSAMLASGGVSLGASKSPLVEELKSMDIKGKVGAQENTINEPIIANNHVVSNDASNTTPSSTCAATKMVQLDIPFLIDPRTKTPTQKVHVFGSTWNVASDDFQTVWFSKLDMALKGVSVGFKAVLLQVKDVFKKCCCSRPSCLYRTQHVV
jgi:rhodanese-related sulfurtransferase